MLNHRLAMRVIGLILLVLCAACSLPGTGKPTPTEPAPTSAPTAVPLPTSTPRPLPPALVENDPPTGAELPLSGPITLYFNQPMERTSVEAAMRSQLEMNGTFTWIDDFTLVFYPDAPLQPATDVKFVLNEEIQASNGLGLLQPVSFNYRTVDFLRPVQVLPVRDAAGVDPTSAVVAAFNYPIVPLGADSAGLPLAFELQPAAQGRGEWINTSTYIFYPQPALQAGQEYSVQINPDLRGTDGSPLETMQPWIFSTTLPRLEKIDPELVGNLARLDQDFTLTFNQPMNPASVEANLTLVGSDSLSLAGSFEWNTDNTVVVFTPNDLLARDAGYELILRAAAQASGGAPLGTDTIVSFRSFPDLAVSGDDLPASGITGAYMGVGIRLTSQLSIERDHSRYIRVEPEITNMGTWWDDYEGVLRVYGDFIPNTDFTVTLAADLPDAWGDTLGEDYSLGFRTAPLEPSLSIPVYPAVVFQPAGDPALVVQAANLQSVPVSVGSLPVEDFFRLLPDENYELRQSYSPPFANTWEQPLDASPDRVEAHDLYLSPDQQALAPGLYFMRVNLPSVQDPAEEYVVVVGNSQATLKISGVDAMLWATDVRDNSPVANAAVTIYAVDGSALASGQTNEDGIFQAEISPDQDPYQPFYAFVNQPGDERFGAAVSTWTRGLESWEYGISMEVGPPRLKIYWYTDRPIYRPGQTVYFRGVLRQATNGRYSLPDLGSLPVSITHDSGQSLAVYDLPLSGYGTVQGEFTLPADARTGYYTIAAPDLTHYDSVGFQVAEYRKPEINLQVSFDSEQVLNGETLKALIDARYFFDAPAGNLPLHWVLYVSPSPFDLPGYQVGPLNTDWLRFFNFTFPEDFGLGEMVQEGDAQTAPDGTIRLELPTTTDKIDLNQRRRFILEVTAKDESGLPVSARGVAHANPAAYVIGVKPDAWNGQEDQPLGFEIQVANWLGQPAGAQSLSAAFSKVVWVREDHVAPNPIFSQPPTYTPQFTLVDSTAGMTDGSGQARLAFTPPEPGTYQLSVTGDGARTEVQIWVSGAGQVNWPSLPNKRLHLVADRQNYKPGDTAQVFIPNPFGKPVQALLTVERGKVLRYQILNLPEAGATVSLPLTGEDAPNIYLSLTVLGYNETGSVDFRQGFVNLDVEPVEQVLNVTLVSQPQQAGPGDEVTFEIRVTDAAGNPVQGEFSLAVVDLAALALADPNSPDIVQAYYSRQPLGVRTALSLSAYTRLFLQPPLGLGGGGGGAMVDAVVRESFPDTAYWNAEIVTDADGKATITVRLPDTLTTWQADLRGLTQDTRVGQARSQIVTRKELLVRPVTPRFLVVHDHAQLAAVVQNTGTNPREVDVTLQATGFTLDEPGTATQHLTVPAGGRIRVEWWGQAQEVDAIDLVFQAATTTGEPALQDAARPALGLVPVLRYNARQTFRTAGTLDEGGERLELVSLPKSFDPGTGELTVELSPSLAAAMLRGLDALDQDPYQSTEQLVSRFLPNLETYRALQEFGLGTPALESRLKRLLDDGLTRLHSRQNIDGGWGWWQGSESDPYMTAYALLGLQQASLAGMSVNESSLNQGTEYLRNSLQAVNTAGQSWELDRLAFQHYVLAALSQGDAGEIQALYEQRALLNPWAQALLVLALNQIIPESAQALTLISDLQSGAIRSATGAYWEKIDSGAQNMVGTVANNAIVLYALAQEDPGSPLVVDAVRFLMANRLPSGAWDSSYATAWTLRALNQVMQGTGELGGDFAFGAFLNEAPLASGQAAGTDQLQPVTSSVPVSSLYRNAPNALLIQREAGSGRLYYTAGLEIGRPVESAPALAQGLAIERRFMLSRADCPNQDCAAIQEAGAGQKITVRLALTVPHDAYHLVVEDYIPAGAEILNTALKTSQQGEGEDPQTQQYDPDLPYASGYGSWYFQEAQIYDDHITWAADYLPAGSYELTYTLVMLQPGEYHVLPARAWQLYFPEVQANSPGVEFAIKP